MIPSLRLYQLLLLGTGLGLAIALMGDNPSSPTQLTIAVAVTLLYDAVLVGLGLVDSQRVRGDRIQLTRQPLHRLSIGRDNPVQLTVRSGAQPAIVQIRDAYPEGFTVAQSVLQLALPAHTEEILTYTVTPTRRGTYAWGNLQVRQRGRWGLAWHDWVVPQSTSVAVYPDLMGLNALSIRLTLEASGNIRRVRRSGMGTEFSELRDYTMGDDPRLVDWKATARRNRLLIRVLEPEQEQTLIVLLDRGRLMTAQVNGLTRFDWGLNATLSLTLAGLSRGDRVGIGIFDRQLQVWIPPDRGTHHLAKCIERVTPVEPTMAEPDYLGAVTAIASQQTRRALVVMLTDLVDETASAELLAAMGQLVPRYLPFCVLLRDPRVDINAHTPVQDVALAYRRAVALDLLNQRQVALAKLKQRGVLILDAPAHQLSDQLVEQYLQLKARGRL